MNPPSAFPGESSLTLTANDEFPRQSDGDVIELKDGRTLLVFGAKPQGNDFSAGLLYKKFSSDQGRTWAESAEMVQAPWEDAWDVCSVNLCRTPRGIHLVFCGRNPVPEGTDQETSLISVYQMISVNEGASWSTPEKISLRRGYNIINNARLYRCRNGRLIIPLAYVAGAIFENYNAQIIYCLFSDDDGVTWTESSSEVALAGAPVMEPGVVECADGSLYMTIRTKLGFLYESRSTDQGVSWSAPTPTTLVSAEAASTVIRDPSGDDLWIFWCTTPYVGNWFDRHTVTFTKSSDNGRTWEANSVLLENNSERSYAYVVARILSGNLFLMYYDWPLDREKPNAGLFHMTSLRQRIIPLSTIDTLWKKML